MARWPAPTPSRGPWPVHPADPRETFTSVGAIAPSDTHRKIKDSLQD
jgi:hypothetical protein